MFPNFPSVCLSAGGTHRDLVQFGEVFLSHAFSFFHATLSYLVNLVLASVSHFMYLFIFSPLPISRTFFFHEFLSQASQTGWNMAGPNIFFGSKRVFAPLSKETLRTGYPSHVLYTLRLQSKQELVPFCTPTNLIALKHITIEGVLFLNCRSTPKASLPSLAPPS